jgi:hypothetical protein
MGVLLVNAVTDAMAVVVKVVAEAPRHSPKASCETVVGPIYPLAIPRRGLDWRTCGNPLDLAKPRKWCQREGNTLPRSQPRRYHADFGVRFTAHISRGPGAHPGSSNVVATTPHFLSIPAKECSLCRDQSARSGGYCPPRRRPSSSMITRRREVDDGSPTKAVSRVARRRSLPGSATAGTLRYASTQAPESRSAPPRRSNNV